MNVRFHSTAAGDYRLAVLDDNDIVVEIFEGEFRSLMDRILKIQDPNTKLAIRKVKRDVQEQHNLLPVSPEALQGQAAHASQDDAE